MLCFSRAGTAFFGGVAAPEMVKVQKQTSGTGIAWEKLKSEVVQALCRECSSLPLFLLVNFYVFIKPQLFDYVMYGQK